jgi:hypothetical protein
VDAIRRCRDQSRCRVCPRHLRDGGGAPWVPNDYPSTSISRFDKRAVPQYQHLAESCESQVRRSRLYCGAELDRRFSELSVEEVLGIGRAGKLLVQPTREVEHRADRPVARDDVLGLPSGVARNENNAAKGLVALSAWLSLFAAAAFAVGRARLRALCSISAPCQGDSSPRKSDWRCLRRWG